MTVCLDCFYLKGDGFFAYIWLNFFLPACLCSAGYPVHPYAFSVRQISSGNASISFPFSKRIVYIISIHSSRMRGDMRDCTSTPPCRFYTLPSYEGGETGTFRCIRVSIHSPRMWTYSRLSTQKTICPRLSMFCSLRLLSSMMPSPHPERLFH